jgi:predicted enzyme related to lactoylglutathione lyase
VADIVTAADTVVERAGQVLSGPMEVPGGDQVAQCLDPQGAAFALHQVAG